MTDILGNFTYAIFLGLLIAVLYLFFSLEHTREPYSRRAKDAMGATLLGFGVEALFWFGLIVLGSKLAESNAVMWQVVMFVIETPILPISLVNISTAIIPLAFTVKEATDGHYDYRVLAIIIVCVLALIFGMYYWNLLSSRV
jgi:hypothetical protein